MSAMRPSYEHQNGGLRHDEIRLPLECDFDRRFAEEQRVVAYLGLHRQGLHLGAAGVWFSPLVVPAGGVGHPGAPGAGERSPAPPPPGLFCGRALPMQDAVTNAAQTQQWSFILSQLFAWVMAGLAWIVPFQSRVFDFVLRGDTFWSLAGTAVLLLLPAGVFIAALWGTMVALYTIPFRLGRSVTLLQSVALAWWGALRLVR